MYHFVENKDKLKRAKKTCSDIMKELMDLLRDEYDISSQYLLVGSGARNMVTQNANKPIDFDYNLNVFNGFMLDASELKETVRKALNRVMNGLTLSDVEDSTSSLTSKPIMFNDDHELQFSIDVCIVTKDKKESWQRLIHKKTGDSHKDTYYWNIAPCSKKHISKANAIKSVPGWWEAVREHYLALKNKYLTQNDHNHPSFICYIQAINDVYSQMRQKHII